MSNRRILYVCRAATGESLRCAQALKSLDGVSLFGVSESMVQDVFVDAIQVANVHDADQLIDAARRLAGKHGSVDHIATAQETLLEPVARVREALNIRGMSVDTVRRTLDKSLLKSTLRRARVHTPRDRVTTSAADAQHFVNEVGFPIMLKPLRGSGALATLLIRTAAELDEALQLMQPSSDHPVLAEVYLQGQELCIDTITIGNEPQLHSICCYYPSILEALEHGEPQWTCVMPREIDNEFYREFIDEGLTAVRALSLGNAMTHMEGFIDPNGRVLGFTDATLRPAGARIGPMLGFAYDVDPYRAWARAAVDGCFDGPWERQYAVGTIFLRGVGSGVIDRVEGIDRVNREVGELIVDSRWPKVRTKKSDTYTGDGYITLRHQNTPDVRQALEFISSAVRIGYSHSASGLQWQERFRDYKELNKPAWELIN